MSRIRGKDTGPERFMLALLSEAGHSPETHARDLPGRPDFVLRDHRVAIFVDVKEMLRQGALQEGQTARPEAREGPYSRFTRSTSLM